MGILYLSDRQTAQRYSVTRGTIWRWIKEHGFPKPVRLSPGCTRWSVGDLEAWEGKQSSEKKEAA